MLLLIVRYIIHRRQRSEEDDEDLAASIEKLKKELQQSADTIIKRLGSHVTKLEGLLREADDRRVRLETRVADAQRLEWALRQRIEELERRLRDLGQNAPAASSPVQAAPMSSTPFTAQIQPQSVPAAQPAEARRMDSDEFAAVLHASILREQARAGTEMPSAASAPVSAAAAPSPTAMQVQPQIVPAPLMPQPTPQQAPMQVSPAPMPSAEEASQPREDEAIGKARALLRAGRTIEQVARETGVEIGALRLMKQMTQRD